MHPSILILLSVTFTLTAAASASVSVVFLPPDHHHFQNSTTSPQEYIEITRPLPFDSHIPNSTTSPQEYIEITRPLPFESLIPSCTLPILSLNFGNTIGLPPTHTSYSSPPNCTWSSSVLHLSAASIGTQNYRIAAVWLDAVEILRTSSPEPSPEGIFWNVHKDVTKYSSLLRQPNLTLSVMLPNVVNDVFTGVYQLNLTFNYYDLDSDATTIDAVNFPLSLLPPKQKSTVGKFPVSAGENYSLNTYEKTPDLTIPVSAMGDEGFWFRIERGSNVKHKGIQIPLNTYRAVIEVCVSFHGNDEFWYSNPPDSYIQKNNLTTRQGNGAYREVLVTIDDNVVGSVIPFPVIFTGGINPLYWNPVVSIGAFDLPSYDIELTPFLGMILDGKVHFFGLGVTDAISFWLVNANLHLWLDDNMAEVKAETVKYSAPTIKIKRKSKVKKLDGKFKIKVERKSEFLGWVNSSFGNLTTYISQNLKFKNTIKIKNNATKKTVKQKVKVKSEVKIESGSGSVISRASVDIKYPLEITTSSELGSDKDTYLMMSDFKNSMEEEKSTGNFTSTLVNSQKSNGSMIVQDGNVVLSGEANTYQSYAVVDGFGCYSRQVLATSGYISNDTTNIDCVSSL